MDKVEADSFKMKVECGRVYATSRHVHDQLVSLL